MLEEDDMRVFSNQKVCSTLLHCSLVESVFVFLCRSSIYKRKLQIKILTASETIWKLQFNTLGKSK